MICNVTAGRALQPILGTDASTQIKSKGLTAPGSSEQEVTLSPLSRQLAESASKAKVRDNTLSREQLRDEHRRLIQQLCGENYDSKRTDTSDPDLIKRARLATEYVVKSDRHIGNLESPFASLSREELTLIVYDENGAYTTDERRAALRGIGEIERRWNRQVIQLGAMEVAAGVSNQPKFCAEIIAHYRTLPPIEQAVYPDNYEARLQAQISEVPLDTDVKDDSLLTLFELLLRISQSQKISEADETEETAQRAPEIRMTNDRAAALTKNN